jgi:hypothetical protein
LTSISEADIELSIAPDASVVNNSFSVTLDEAAWAQDPIEIGHSIYIPGTEFGGIVTLIIHNTAQRSVTMRGPTWRGILFQQAIEPPPEQSHYILTDTDANTAILSAVGPYFGGLFRVSTEVTDIDVNASWRYITCAGGLHAALASSGARLNVAYNNADKVVDLWAALARDLSNAVELSQDFGVDFTSSAGRLETYNRCLALGPGELAARMVVNVYRDEEGYHTTKPSSWDEDAERTVVLDYPNAESEADLIASAQDRLREFEAENTITIDQLLAAADVEMGDRVSVRDRLTGMTAQATIYSKILSIQGGVIKIDLKVG